MKPKHMFIAISVIVAILVIGLVTNATITGKATQKTCTDADGGKTYDILAECTDDHNTYIDHCVVGRSYVNLREYACNDDGICAPQLYKCKLGCEAGACR